MLHRVEAKSAPGAWTDSPRRMKGHGWPSRTGGACPPTPLRLTLSGLRRDTVAIRDRDDDPGGERTDARKPEAASGVDTSKFNGCKGYIGARSTLSYSLWGAQNTFWLQTGQIPTADEFAHPAAGSSQSALGRTSSNNSGSTGTKPERL